MGGDGGALGNGASAETETKATQTQDPKAKDNPLLAILQDKMFMDKDTKEPVSGLLYFPLDGKVKLKDLELIYKGPAGRLIVPVHAGKVGASDRPPLKIGYSAILTESMVTVSPFNSPSMTTLCPRWSMTFACDSLSSFRTFPSVTNTGA